MNSRLQLTGQVIRFVMAAFGILMVVGAVVFVIVDGFSFMKAVLVLAGCSVVALAWFGSRIRTLYPVGALVIVNTLGLLILLEVVATVILRFSPPRTTIHEEQAALPYYQRQEWGAGYWKESREAARQIYVPYVVWKRPAYAGEYINVDEQGTRLTPDADCSPDAYTVFTFGGSTMWGDGVPDWGTIAAYLQIELDAMTERPVCTINLGQTAWVSTQSVIELLRHLQSGNYPDLVIFYDGGNDVTSPIEEGVPGGHYNISGIRSRLKDGPSPLRQILISTSTFRLLEKIIPSLSSLRDDPNRNIRADFDNETMSEAIVQAYLANYRTVKALSEEFDFDYAFFWQPLLLYGQKPLTDEEKDILSHQLEILQGVPELLQEVYPQIEAATEDYDHLFYLADMFNSVTEGLYVDDIHLTPTGNQMVAQRMIEILTDESIIKEQS